MENSFINGLIPLSTSPSDETKIDELFRAIPSGSILPAAKVFPFLSFSVVSLMASISLF